jgi:hypothetical protein
MSDGSPQDDAWLRSLIDRSPLLCEHGIRREWRRLVPWMDVAARYELAAILLEVEHAISCD